MQIKHCLEELKHFKMGVLENCQEGVKRGLSRAAHSRTPFSDKYTPSPI